MAERELSDEMKWLLQQPVTFDPLRDPNWKPSREDYQAIRDTLAGHLAATAEKSQQAEQREKGLRELLQEWLTADPHSHDWLDFEDRVRAALAVPEPAPEPPQHPGDPARDEAHRRWEEEDAAIPVEPPPEEQP